MSLPPQRFAAFAIEAVVVVALTIAIAIVYWPGLDGYWGRDDFAQLALVRLLDSPWPLFAHDHYPVPGSIFRPLGFASLWLSERIAGEDYRAHALLDLALHVLVALAFYRVVRLAVPRRWMAVIWTLLFALHPAVIGTAQWWSDRFDLLATLFALVAVRAAGDYAARPRWPSLTLALIATLAAALSKELGLAAVAPIGLLWLTRARSSDPSHRAYRASLAALAAVVLGYFAWRSAVLGTAASALTGEVPLAQAIASGLARWFGALPGYLSWWPRLAPWSKFGLVAAAMTWVALVVAAARHRSSRPRDDGARRLVIGGIAIVAAAAFVQSPVTALNGAALTGDVSAVQAAMQSRLFYLGLAGIVLTIAGVDAWFGAAGRASERWRGLAVSGAVVVLGIASHAVSREFAERTYANGAIARAAVDAVARTTLPGKPCHVHLLGIEPPSEWSAYVFPDSIVKALSPDLERVSSCLFHGDTVTYFHLVPRDSSDVAGEFPFARVRPPMQVGTLDILYLRPPAPSSAGGTATAVFLRYDHGTFRDITADVAAGRPDVTPN